MFLERFHPKQKLCPIVVFVMAYVTKVTVGVRERTVQACCVSRGWRGKLP